MVAPHRGGVDRNHQLDHWSIAHRLSPPTRGRGSKPRASTDPAAAGQVAPHAGAWIETYASLWRWLLVWSPPMRGRGSKRSSRTPAAASLVAPHRGGVDRNSGNLSRSPPISVALHRGGVDRNLAPHAPVVATAVALHRGGVDRNVKASKQPTPGAMSPSCGGVDRNVNKLTEAGTDLVALHAGAWIETGSGAAYYEVY